MFKRHNLIILFLFNLININYVNCFVKFNLYNGLIQCHFITPQQNNKYFHYTLNRNVVLSSLEEEFEEVKKKFLIDNTNKRLNKDNNKDNNQNNNKDNDNLNFDKTEELTLLNNVISGQWAKTWIYDMVGFDKQAYPKYVYSDIFYMRDYIIKNNKEYDFYIGFYPKKQKCDKGPYFIGAFKLIPNERMFSCNLIIQNPNYIELDQSYFLDYKKNLINMCEQADVKFDYINLKNLENKRYWMSWRLNLND
jgi:hypothetical protein